MPSRVLQLSRRLLRVLPRVLMLRLRPRRRCWVWAYLDVRDLRREIPVLWRRASGASQRCAHCWSQCQSSESLQPIRWPVKLAVSQQPVADTYFNGTQDSAQPRFLIILQVFRTNLCSFRVAFPVRRRARSFSACSRSGSRRRCLLFVDGQFEHVLAQSNVKSPRLGP